MQFKVPQFLDIEDKIFGPFTFRQFVYLAGGAGICFVLYKLMGLFLGALPIIPIAGFSLALAFYRPNNKPFINMVEASAKYIVQDKLYIWKKGKIHKNDKLTNEAMLKGGMHQEREQKLTGSKLKDLAWSLDVLDMSSHKDN